MKTIKILLMGITGDLAAKKILPAVAQFAQINESKFNTELIGYSRSKADSQVILDILDKNSKNGKNKLHNITYITSQYDDANTLDDIFSSLNKDERLFIYLAIPPAAFTSFLGKACPFNHANIDIIIEKPFGQNLEDAKEIISKSQTCILTKRINFFDHYSFKASSKINKENLDHLSKYVSGKIKKVEIKALEKVDVRGREGYYNQTGAIKDMFQHLVTIYVLAGQYFSLPDLHSSNMVIDNLITGQYDNYQSQTENANIGTDTYFKADITGENGLKILAESGKCLGIKSTSITLIFEDNSTLVWNLDPDKHISVIRNNKEVVSFNLIDNNLFDHTRLFQSIIRDDYSRFVTHKEIYKAWHLYNEIIDYKNHNDIQPIIYESGLYPIKPIAKK